MTRTTTAISASAILTPKSTSSLLFCVSGSIAATSTVALLRILIERELFAGIRVALSESALQFVREEPFAVLSGHRCITDIFASAAEGHAIHVEIAQTCQFALVAPATGNLVAKLALGIADDTITNLLSVFEGHRILAPAVHPATSRKPAFERNLRQLREDGFMLCGPVDGFSMSEKRRGPDVAAMPAPETVAAFVEHVVLAGKPPDVEFYYPTHCR